MGRLLRENEISLYTRRTGENWDLAPQGYTNKIAKHGGDYTFNSLAWSYSPSANRLVKLDDFTKKGTNIAFILPSYADGRDGNWGIGGDFYIPLWNLLSGYKIACPSAYSSSTIFRPEYYIQCAENITDVYNVTVYNSSGVGTSTPITDVIGDSYGVYFMDANPTNVLGFKMYFLKYGDGFGYPKEPWEYLEYEGSSEDFYDLAQDSDFIIGNSLFKSSYWPSNFSNYALSSNPSGVNYYDARGTNNASSAIYVGRTMLIDSDTFYIEDYDLMCLELAVVDITYPAHSYPSGSTLSGYVSVPAGTKTALKPCISPLAPNVSPSAEQTCCQVGKINLSPYLIISNLSSKGYVNNLKTVYIFTQDYNSSYATPVWGTVNIYGLFYVIPLVADNPHVYHPTTDLFPLSNNNIGLYFHTAEAGSPLPTFYTA